MKSKNKKYKVFISYCKRDSEYLTKITNHLSVLVRNDTIDIWYDEMVLPGVDIELETSVEMARANIVLFLITAEYLAFEKCYKELEIFLEEKQSRNLIPIIVKECNWENTPLNNLKVLPRNGKSLINQSWNNIDEPLNSITIEITNVINSLDKRIKPNNDIKEAYEYHMIARNLQLKGRLEDSIKFFKKGVEVYEENFKAAKEEFVKISGNYARFLNDFSQSYLFQKDFENQFQLIEKSLLIRQQVFEPNYVELGDNYIDLGQVYRNFKNYDKAIESINKGINIYKKNFGEIHVNIGIAYQNLAGIYYDKSNLKEAKKYLDDAIEVLEKAILIDSDKEALFDKYNKESFELIVHGRKLLRDYKGIRNDLN